MRKIIYGVVIIISLILGFVFGISWQSKCPIEIDNKIRYSELLNWITTLCVGFYVSYILRNQFENNKTTKTYLLEDIKTIIASIVELKTNCNGFKTLSILSEEQKGGIVSKLNAIDKRITVFCQFFEECYSNKAKNDKDNLINSYNQLNKIITGSGMYANPINPAYFDEITAESARFESELRKLTLKIINKY